MLLPPLPSLPPPPLPPPLLPYSLSSNEKTDDECGDDSERDERSDASTTMPIMALTEMAKSDDAGVSRSRLQLSWLRVDEGRDPVPTGVLSETVKIFGILDVVSAVEMVDEGDLGRNRDGRALGPWPDFSLLLTMVDGAMGSIELLAPAVSRVYSLVRSTEGCRHHWWD